MNDDFDRRSLLRFGAAASAAVLSQPFIGIPALAGYATSPALRRNASPLADTDPILKGYRKAIVAMRTLADTDPCSWFYQAAIHGTFDGRNLTAWNTCHTDPTFFWAWHRMYLYWFERIARKYSGMYDWALPYWDWTVAAQATIPAPFRVAGNALYDGTRNASMNSGAGSISASTRTSAINSLTPLDYFNAQSALNGPHGSVHVAVSGNMSSVSTAAQDPIFWLHHAQIDRMWNLWLAQGGGRSSPVGDATWRNSTYTFFDECCRPVTMKGCDVLRAALQLGYGYEGEPAQVSQYCPLIWRPDFFDIVVLTRWPRPFPLTKGIVRLRYDALRDDVAAAKRLSDIARTSLDNAMLQLKGVEAASQPGVSWEVHLGRAGFNPDGASFVGSFALFSAGLKTRHHHYTPAEFVFPINKAIRAADGAVDLELVFVPVSGVDTGAGPLRKLGRRKLKIDLPGLLQQGATAEPRSEVIVSEVNILIDRAMPQPPREEQEKLRLEEQRQ